MFKRKKRENVVEQEPQPYEIKNITGDDILNGVCPWAICKTDRDDLKGYKIKIFLFDLDNEWEDFTKYSKEVIGISKEEILRVLEERFNAIGTNKSYSINSREAIFLTVEDAAKAIEEFKPYYESFYMPRAIAKRLLCYTEGGYPPYFTDKYDGQIIYEKNSENC